MDAAVSGLSQETNVFVCFCPTGMYFIFCLSVKVLEKVRTIFPLPNGTMEKCHGVFNVEDIVYEAE